MTSRQPAQKVQAQFQRALAQGLRRVRPDLPLSPAGYVAAAGDNLLPGLALADVAAELAAGAGDELAVKIRAAHSSAALAVNCFAPLRRDGVTLRISDRRNLVIAGFERRFPVGLPRAQPPHLDVVAEGEGGLVAIESKCTEYLAAKIPRFSPRYLTISDRRAHDPWFAQMMRLMRGEETYALLDAAQLVKHAFGIARAMPEGRASLLYLYLEPLDADRFPAFHCHRGEIERFANRVEGGHPAFRAMSYAALWQGWREDGRALLRQHVAALEARYTVALAND